MSTRKIRNVVDGSRTVALVIDDMVSFDPFIARGIRVYGLADPPVERVGLVGPGYYIRITPRTSWSWNMEGQPVGDTWYPARCAVHETAAARPAGDPSPDARTVASDLDREVTTWPRP